MDEDLKLLTEIENERKKQKMKKLDKFVFLPSPILLFFCFYIHIIFLLSLIIHVLQINREHIMDVSISNVQVQGKI